MDNGEKLLLIGLQEGIAGINKKLDNFIMSANRQDAKRGAQIAAMVAVNDERERAINRRIALVGLLVATVAALIGVIF